MRRTPLDPCFRSSPLTNPVLPSCSQSSAETKAGGLTSGEEEEERRHDQNGPEIHHNDTHQTSTPTTERVMRKETLQRSMLLHPPPPTSLLQTVNQFIPGVLLLVQAADFLPSKVTRAGRVRDDDERGGRRKWKEQLRDLRPKLAFGAPGATSLRQVMSSAGVEVSAAAILPKQEELSSLFNQKSHGFKRASLSWDRGPFLTGCPSAELSFSSRPWK